LLLSACTNDDSMKNSTNHNHHFCLDNRGAVQARSGANCKKWPKKLNVQIEFLEFRSDIPDILCIFDIFVITSRWEPFGIAVLESMAARVPVVGFAVDRVQEIVNAGAGGVLIAQRCHRTVAQLIVDTLRNRAQYRRFQDEGLSNVRNNFNIVKCIKKLEWSYFSVLAKTNENTSDQ